jgi:hypothetical protein
VSLLKYAIAAAIGYYAGQPGGRRQVQQLVQKVTELVRSPKAAELKDRGRELVGERASAAVDKVRRKSADDPTTSGTSATGPVTTGSASTTPVGGSAVGGGVGERAAADDLGTLQAGVLPPGPAPRSVD